MRNVYPPQAISPEIENTPKTKYLSGALRIFSVFLLLILSATSVSAQCIGPASDCDGDGILNVNDLDDDNDGILDVDECPSGICDPDNDTISNEFDLDSDGDGCFDVFEGDGGFIHSEVSETGHILSAVSPDGVPTNVDVGVCPQASGTAYNSGSSAAECDACNAQSSLYADTDSDGVADACDDDDDNDGITDATECPSEPCDFDNDGLSNSIDLDSDNDGCPDGVEGNGGFNTQQLTAEDRLSGSVSSNGIPTLAGTGQLSGQSLNSSVHSDCGTIAVRLDANNIACPDAIVPYHLTLTNSSTDNFTGISVTDVLPSGFTFLYDTLDYHNGSSGPTYSNNLEGAVNLTWKNIDIPAGSSVVISYDAIVEPNITEGAKTNNIELIGAPMDNSSISTSYVVSAVDCLEDAIGCQPAFYQVYKKPGGQQIYGKLNVLTQAYTFISYLPTKANALGFDRDNNMAYGANGKKFISLDEEGKITYLGVDFTRNTFSGDMDTLGNWWGRDGSDMVRINIQGLGLTRFTGQGIPGADMAYNADGNFYSISNKKLHTFDTQSMTKTNLGSLSGDALPSGAYGAQWTGKDGKLYASHNSTGNIYKIDLEERTAILVMISEGGLNQNDGFSCPDQIPAVYQSEFGDNSNYGNAGHLINVQDIGSDNVPDFTMAWAGDIVSGENVPNLNSNASSDAGDDGLTYSTELTAGQSTTFQIELNSHGGITAHYGLWIDWNNDNNFDEFQTGSSTISSKTTISLNALVPATFSGGVLNVRLRVTEESLSFSHAVGFMLVPGEVEDYRYTATVPSEICGNGIDDDGDGLTDCADGDCGGAACGEVAYNTFDDDGDGNTDQADSDVPAAAFSGCYNVDTTDDTNDANLGDGICADASGNCSLRAAIQEANASSGYNCINFSVSGTISISSQLVVTESVGIFGQSAPGYSSGSPAVKVQDSGFTPFLINNADDVLIRGLDISGTPGGFANYGIQTLNATNVTVRDNTIRYRQRGLEFNNTEDIVIRDNDLYDSGNECWDAAIYIDGLTKNNIPNGIYIDGNSMGGLTLEPQTILHISDADGVRISDGSLANSNIIMDGPFDCWHPIRIVDVNNATIANIDLSYPTSTFFGIGVWTVSCDNVVMDNMTVNNRARAVFVDGGSNHIVSNSDLRDSGSNADNGALTWHNYNASGQQDAHAYDNTFGNISLNPSTLLALRKSHNFIVSDGSESGTNIELPATVTQKNPIRLYDSDYTAISKLDFSYSSGIDTDNRGIWLQGGCAGTVIDECTFKGRASAIHMENANSTTLQCNIFSRNKNAMSLNGNSTVASLKNNDLECNRLAVNNLASSTVDAQENFWGDAAGSSSYSGVGDYYFGNVDASEFLDVGSNCSPTVASNTCVQEICDNGIDDDGDGLIDCEDGACVTTVHCGGGLMEIEEGSPIAFTFDESNEFWFIKNIHGANLYPVKSTLVNDVDNDCGIAFIPPPPSGTDFIYENDTDLDITLMSSSRLNGLDLSEYIGHSLAWHWYTGNYSGTFGTTDLATDLQIILENSSGQRATATVEAPGTSHVWTPLSISFTEANWTLTDGGDWSTFLTSIDFLILQVDAYNGGLAPSCGQREFFAIDDMSFVSDSVTDEEDSEETEHALGTENEDNAHHDCDEHHVNELGELICTKGSTRDEVYSSSDSSQDDSAAQQKGTSAVSSQYKIYPNPSLGVFNISVPEEHCSIELYDLNQRRIELPVEFLINGVHEVDISNESGGLYILVIQGMTEIQHHQLIKR